MNASEIATIRADFARILDRADDFAGRFYHRLFEIGPELREHFPQDLRPLTGKLMEVLGFIVASLDSVDTVLAAAKAGGFHTDRLDVDPHHYVLVGEALLDTLEQELGDLTDAARQAWVTAYTVLADHVVDAQRQALLLPVDVTSLPA